MNGNSRAGAVALFFVAVVIGAAIGAAVGLLISAWLGWG